MKSKIISANNVNSSTSFFPKLLTRSITNLPTLFLCTPLEEFGNLPDTFQITVANGYLEAFGRATFAGGFIRVGWRCAGNEFFKINASALSYKSNIVSLGRDFISFSIRVKTNRKNERFFHWLVIQKCI